MENKNTAVLCPTKAGNGYKIFVGEKGGWLYCSKSELHNVISKGYKCTFRTIGDKPQRNQEHDGGEF